MAILRTEDEIISSWRSDIAHPVVSISCITYNHEAYIQDALIGFLIQETNFPFEILIHDDASTDGTADVIRRYEAMYPTLIKPICQTENQYSQGKRISADFNFSRATGDYIALCEGDDYWTDKAKLHKQISFLNKNPDFSMSSHSIRFEFDGVVEKRKQYAGAPVINAGLDEVLGKGLFIALNSIVFRRKYFLDIPPWLYKLPGWHKALIYMMTGQGKNHHFMQEMGVKRRHSGGMTVRLKKAREETYLSRNIYLLENLKSYLSHTKDVPINKKLKKLYFRQALQALMKLKIIDVFQNILHMLKCSVL